MVEFALLTPMLMVLMVGTVDGGRALYAAVSVDNAAFHSAIWTSNHLKQGTAGTPSCGSVGAICCPYANNTTAYVEGSTTPTSIREIVLRDFLAGLTVTNTCPATSSTIGSDCNPAVECSTGSESYTYGGGTAYRYVDVTVTYRWSAVGPYGPIVGSVDIPRTTRMRKVP